MPSDPPARRGTAAGPQAATDPRSGAGRPGAGPSGAGPSGADPPGADPPGADPPGAGPPEATSEDVDLLRRAVALAGRSPRSATAYAVGAVVVTATECAVGWSRAGHPHDHAEEVALAALAGPATGGTLYTSLEPCSARRSRPRTCTELVLAAGLARVVFALREPPLLADCHGAELLAAAGVEVLERPELAGAVRAVNAHLIG